MRQHLLFIVMASAWLARPPATSAAPPTAAFDVRFQVREGNRTIDGMLNAWDAEGFEGTFGRFAWRDLPAEHAWHVLAQLIDVNRADQWLLAGKIMSKVSEGQGASSRALQWAKWLSQQTAAEAEREMSALPVGLAVKPVAPLHARGPSHGAVAVAAHLGEVEAWVHYPPEEQRQAVELLKRESQTAFANAELKFNLYENAQFLFYTDVPEEEARQWLAALENVFRSLAMTFGFPADNIFWGKAVVVMCRTQQDFSMLQQRAFGFTPPPDMAGVTHPTGPKVICTFWMLPDEDKLGHTVAHEITHAFVHRLWTNASFPMWFDEGFADYAAAAITVGTPVDAVHWPVVHAFVTTGGPIDAILDTGCSHDGWPGPRNVHYGVSYYLVRMMFEENSNGVLRFMAAVKMGKNWEQALKEDYGQSREELIQSFVTHVSAQPANPPPAPPMPGAKPPHR